MKYPTAPAAELLHTQTAPGSVLSAAAARQAGIFFGGYVKLRVSFSSRATRPPNGVPVRTFVAFQRWPTYTRVHVAHAGLKADTQAHGT